ncbi:MAG: enoyl-CoA hydratase/isomerase family protein [Actinomycetia bacterium]|nr:enoyl-CoA hydratase/isomerase family protein [Actinomycetes bacterium]
MSEFTEIAVDREGATATVTLDRPDALNAITPTMLGELNRAFDAVAADPGVRVVVLTGRGRAFSAGVDLKALGQRELVDGKVGDILDVPARHLTHTISTMAPSELSYTARTFTGVEAAEGSLSEGVGLEAGLAHEYGSDYPFTDTAERLADFR